MPHPELPAYQEGFFQKFLADLPGTPTVAALEQQQPAGQPLTLAGEYIEYQGGPVTPLPNASITPQFAIRADVNGSPQTFVMLWLVERIDVATDSAATIARILADFRPPTGQTGTTPVTSELARTWSQALTAEGVRQALAKSLAEITEVPAGLPTSDLNELKTFLAHFGTYKADGTYYTKGTVSEGQFPAGVSDQYVAPDTGNLSEIKLQRDQFYCYALAAERLWNPQAAATRFRQLVYRIEDQGADAAERWRLALVHTVGATLAAGAGSRFIVFHAPVGLGLALPAASLESVAPSMADVLEDVPADPAALQTLLNDPSIPIVGHPDSPYVLLIGAVKEGFPSTPLPEGVIEDGEGVVRTFRCPPSQLRALVEREDIQHLEAAAPVWPLMTHAFQKINYGARTYPSGITAATTGRGIVVGIVDSGIDGAHPAFLGRQDDATKSRIHSVWNMWESGGQSPYARSGNKAEYNAMRYGKEYRGHDEVITAPDHGDHGTHVAGIAAGRAVGSWPGGVAPGATLVVAGLGRGFVTDVIAGVKYCFQKAAELNLPCVVNISQGTERHSHDGTDPLSVVLTQLLSVNRLPNDPNGFGVLASAMPVFREGRIIVAAAGNLRNDATHWQATIPANGEVSLVYNPAPSAGTLNADGITFWAYNEDATTVRLRISARHSTNAVLAAPEVALMTSNRRVSTDLTGGIRVDIHNGPVAPNNRHFNPEIYWVKNPANPFPAGPWIVRLRNTTGSPCVIHGFCAFREKAGAFVFDPAVTQPLISVTYTADQLRAFNSHKVSTPGTSPGCVSVAAFTSEPGLPAGHVENEIAFFSSPGPLRAAGPGRRALDVAMPGHRVVSARAGTTSVIAKSGTSMASPVMAGLVAAMLQMNPRLTAGNIKARLELAATRRPTDTVDDWGLGRVDASILLRPDIVG